VQQTVLAGQQRDERAECRDLDDGSEELLADLRVRRVGDRVDLGPCSVCPFGPISSPILSTGI
jgi:hypothetical protein